MKILRILKPSLFIYECVRVIILALIIVLQRNEGGQSLRMIYAASATLFPLMALFLCLDMDRYKAYIPLMIAGKSIGLVLQGFWYIINFKVQVFEFNNLIPYLTSFIINGDIIFLAVTFKILKEVKWQEKIDSVQETQIEPTQTMEEK